MQRTLSSRWLTALPWALALVLICGGGQCRKKTDFTSATTPTTVQPDSSGSGSGTSKQPEPIGGDFAEPPIQDADNTAGNETGATGADPIAANLAPIYFEYDSFALSDEALQVLGRNANWLQSHPGARVLVEGHCDERGSLEYNLDLGAKRARIVREQLVRLGVAGGRLSTVSKGETEPADTSGSDSAFARNRRAEFESAP